MDPPESDRRSFGHPEEELVSALEPDQLVAEASRPLPRYMMGRGGRAALWVVRIFVLLITLMVVYTFVVGLRQAPR